MKHSSNRLRLWTLPLCLALSAALVSACATGSDTQSPDATAGIESYSGTWTQNGVSGTFDATKTLTIGPDLTFEQTIHQYESTAKQTLAWTKGVTGSVAGVSVDENNEAYDTLFIDIDEVRITPESATQANDWNTTAYGGVTAWVPQTTRTFDSANPGTWEQGAIWLDHVAVSVQREGDLLNVNERGGFDGQDPPQDVYYLEP